MKYLQKILVMILIISSFAGTAVGKDQVVFGQSEQDAKIAAEGDIQDINISMLEINPRYTNVRLQPGETREVSVTVKNKDDETISVKPAVVIQPFGEYIMDKNWITISPKDKDIAPEQSQKFMITVVIPEDASTGYFNPMIVFTDEVYPTPYPSPVPNYAHSLSLSIDVWKIPSIQIKNQYINDRVEAGKETDYKITLKNIGKESIPIDPKITPDDMYYGPYGSPQALSNDAVTITAPKEVPAGGSAEVNVHIQLPVDAKGSYHSAIDLGIQDASMRDPYMYRVMFDLSVWTQPVEAYVKSFTAKDAVVSIEVNSGMGPYYPYIQSSQNKKDPSFTIKLTGSDNKEITLKKTKTVIKGGASLGSMMYAPWEMDSQGIYQDMTAQYSETYLADVRADDYKLSILPQNTDAFEYTITMENN